MPSPRSSPVAAVQRRQRRADGLRRRSSRAVTGENQSQHELGGPEQETGV